MLLDAFSVVLITAIPALLLLTHAYFSPLTWKGRPWTEMTRRERVAHTLARMWEISKKGPFYILLAKLSTLAVRITGIKLDGGKGGFDWKRPSMSASPACDPCEDWVQQYRGAETHRHIAGVGTAGKLRARVKMANGRGSSVWAVTGQLPLMQLASPTNGGRADEYTWSQTHDEVVLEIPLQDVATRAKQLNVVVKTTSLLVELATATPPKVLLSGDLNSEVRPDDCDWELKTVRARRLLVVTLGKKKKRAWWSRVLRGDAKIDVSTCKNDV